MTSLLPPAAAPLVVVNPLNGRRDKDMPLGRMAAFAEKLAQSKDCVNPLSSELSRREIERGDKASRDKALAKELELSEDCVAAFAALRDALLSSSASRDVARRTAWERSRTAVLKLQDTLLSLAPPRLLSSVRLEPGSTLLHLAVLWKLHQRPDCNVVHLLMRLEPPLLSATYKGPLYRDENLLHMAVAHGDGELVLELAAFALQPHPGLAGPNVVGGGGYLYGNADTDTQVAEGRDMAWRVLFNYEKKQNRVDSTEHAKLDPAWCAAWLRAAWIGMVNREATGTFFMPPPSGECYYGGTPLAFAVVLGHASIVRTLTVDVGCVDPQPWLIWRHVHKQRAERAAAKASLAAVAGSDQKLKLPAQQQGAHLSKSLPLLLARKLDVLGPCELLEDWDADLCARIDLHETHRGNTAAHMAILTSEDSAMYFFLDDLYSAGYGRWNSADLYAAAAGARSKLPRKTKLTKAERDALGIPSVTAPPSPTSRPPPPSSFATLKKSLDATNRTNPPNVFSLVRRQVLLGKQLPSVASPGPREINLDLLPPSTQAAATSPSTPSSPARAGSAERSSPPPSPIKAASSHDEESAEVQAQCDAAPVRKAFADLAEIGAENGSRPRLGAIINAQGLTAQTLAASLGNREQFVDLWRSRSTLTWTWGGVTRRQFPLDEVDDIGQCADDHPTIFNATIDKKGEQAQPPSTAWSLLRQLLPLATDAGSNVDAVPRQPTALEQIVLAGHWRLLADLADKDEEELNSIRASNREAMRADERELRRAEAEERRLLKKAQYEAHELLEHMEEKRANGGGDDAIALSQALAVAKVKHAVASKRVKKIEQLAPSSIFADNDDAEDDAEGGGGGRGEARDGGGVQAALDGEEGEAEVAGAKIARAGGTLSGTSLLRQLLQVKWEKVYRGLFLWRMVERLAFVMLLWATLLVRTSQGVLGPSDGSAGAFPAEPLYSCRARLAAERRAVVPGDSSDAALMAFSERSCAAAGVLVPLLAALLAVALCLQAIEIEARTRIFRSFLKTAVARCLPRTSGVAGEATDDTRDTAEMHVELVRRGIKLPEDKGDHAALLRALRAAPVSASEGTGFSSRASSLWHAGYGSALGHFYLGTRLLFLVLSLAATIVDILCGWLPSTSILYALGGFAGTLHLLYFLVGFARTGPLVMMIYSNVLSEFVRWLFVFLPLILSFTIAFFALNVEHSWADLVNHDLLYAFQTATVSGQAEQVLNDNPNVEGSADARMWLGFFIVCNFIVSTKLAAPGVWAAAPAFAAPNNPPLLLFLTIAIASGLPAPDDAAHRARVQHLQRADEGPAVALAPRTRARRAHDRGLALELAAALARPGAQLRRVVPPLRVDEGALREAVVRAVRRGARQRRPWRPHVRPVGAAAAAVLCLDREQPRRRSRDGGAAQGREPAELHERRHARLHRREVRSWGTDGRRVNSEPKPPRAFIDEK